MKKPPPSPLHIKQRKEGEGVFLRNIYILEQFLKIIILIWQKISCVILQNSVGWGGGGSSQQAPVVESHSKGKA